MGKTASSYDVIVIGAGVGGIYQIKRLVDAGFNAILVEGDDDLGGTWYRNRYPGCRFDSESYTYGYSFSQELLDEWHWRERFSPQPENLRYLNYVAEKFDLRSHMRFNTFIESMAWNAADSKWCLTTSDGEELHSRFVVSAMGPLSVPTMPSFPGQESFSGRSFHTYWWPEDLKSLAGSRVGIIGTGATGIQIIGAIASEVASLTVFQRRPNWSSPLNNSPISETEMGQIRDRYAEIFANCAATPSGFEHLPDRRGYHNFTPAEREAIWDELYQTPGFAILAGNFVEVHMDEAANAEFSAYMARKIRERVKDPATADKLIPRDHGFGMQRLPLETRYFEAYNYDHVELVDISATPIEAVTPDGVKTSTEEFDLDVLIYATGFDAITGAYDRVPIQGIDGLSLADKWAAGPQTYFGLMTSGFPNLFMLAGPQSASGASNFPRGIEVSVDWVTELLQHARANKVKSLDAQPEAEMGWVEEVKKSYANLLLRKGKGWFVGYNSNVAGRTGEKNRLPAYQGGGARYAKLLKEMTEEDYRGINFSS